MSLHRLAGAALLIGLVLASTSSRAMSDATEAFRTNVRLRIVFLMKAGTLAETNAGSARVRAFAGRQTREQSGVLVALESGEARGTAVAAEGTETKTAEASTPATGSVLTGRSAVDGHEAGTFEAPAVGVLMPAAAAGLQHLAESKGQAFDALYTSLAHNMLADLSGFYETYERTGDDPALRALAAGERAKVDADKLVLERATLE